jgi:hypothetical protein
VAEGTVINSLNKEEILINKKKFTTLFFFIDMRLLFYPRNGGCYMRFFANGRRTSPLQPNFHEIRR